MPRKQAVVEEDEGPDKSWLESWADAMTLLMAFFIMMFAFALVDETKFADFKVGMVTALGVSDPVNERADDLLESGNGIALTVGLSSVPTEEMRNEIDQSEGDLAEDGTVTTQNIEDVRELLEDKFVENGASGYVTVDIDERGIVIRYDGRVLFRSGSAELGINSDTILASTSDVLQLIDNPIDIEGHTDDVPTGGQWLSNWELSSARASAVVRWMIDFGRIPPRRLAAVGMADTRPLADNDSEDGRTQNRRVEVVVRVNGLLESDIDVLEPLGDLIDAANPGPADSASNQAAEIESAPTEPAPNETATGGPAQPLTGPGSSLKKE